MRLIAIAARLTGLTLSMVGIAYAQTASIDLGAVLKRPWRLVGHPVTTLRDSGNTILRFGEQSGVGLAWNPAIVFQDGDIEVDVRGRDELQKSFIGIVFHVANDSTFDTVWLRPFNFRSQDPSRPPHSLQFASYPEYPWQRLREEHPGGFEAALTPTPDPNGWIHLRIAVRGQSVRVYVAGAATPALAVTSPGKGLSGGVGLFVGDQSNGDFMNLRIRVAQ